LVNWWWKLLLLMNINESLVNYWILTKWCLNLEFWASLSVFFMHMTYKHYLERVLSVERSKLECLGKRVVKFEVFFSGLKSVRLSELWANLRRVCPSHFWTQFTWASRERSLSEQECCFWTEFAWANRKRAPSEQANRDLVA